MCRHQKIVACVLPLELSLIQVAVCCSVLQCVAVCCRVLQSVAVCCSVLQCVAVCCSVLQCVAVCRHQEIVARALPRELDPGTAPVARSPCSAWQCVAMCCSVWQCVAVCCSVFQCVIVCCSIWQCVVVCCSMCCSVLWWVVTLYILPHTTCRRTRCNKLQHTTRHTATHCNACYTRTTCRCVYMNDSFMCVTRSIHLCGVSHLYVQRGAFICAMRHICTCAMTYSYV